MTTSAAYRNLGLTVPVTEVLDPDKWIERYAAGLPGLDPARLRPGTESGVRDACAGAGEALTGLRDQLFQVSKSTIRWHLRAALSEIEMKIGQPMGIVVCKSDPLDPGEAQGVTFDRLLPPKAYRLQDAAQYYKLDLPGNVISVERIRGYAYQQKVWELSAERGNLDNLLLEWPRQGGTHTLPITITQFIVPANVGTSPGFGLTMLELLAFQGGSLPGFWRIDCTLGPVSNQGQIGQVETILAHWCGLRAAIALLPMAAVALNGGVGQSSVTFDGYTRSTSLAGKHAYAAISDAFKALDDSIDWDRLRDSKRPFRLVSLSR